MEIIINGAQGKNIEEPNDIDKEIALLKQKLGSSGNPVKTFRSAQNIGNIYNDSIFRLIKKFLEKAHLFDDLYVSNIFRIYINGSMTNLFESNWSTFVNSRNEINGGTTRVSFEYHYEALKQLGFSEFRYHSHIYVFFQVTNYSIAIFNEKNILIEKNYETQLTDEEILFVVNKEIRTHKEQIEKKIKT